MRKIMISTRRFLREHPRQLAYATLALIATGVVLGAVLLITSATALDWRLALVLMALTGPMLYLALCRRTEVRSWFKTKRTPGHEALARRRSSTSKSQHQQPPATALNAGLDIDTTQPISLGDIRDGTPDESYVRPIRQRNLGAQPAPAVTVRTLDTKPRKSHSREIAHEGGRTYLVVTSTDVVKHGHRKREWIEKTQRLQVERSSIVNLRLLGRTNTVFLDSETEIHCFDRQHWWSHGPGQIAVALSTILVMVATIYGMDSAHANPRLTALVTLAVLLIGTTLYGIVWMKWAYTYMVLTNQRLSKHYEPPWIIPGNTRSAPLVKFIDTNVDETAIGAVLGYGKFTSETTATDTDLWIRKGIDHVRKHKVLEQVFKQLQQNALERSLHT